MGFRDARRLLIRGLVASRSTYSEGLAYGVLSFGCLAVLSTVGSIAVARIYGIETLGRYALIAAAVNATLFLSTAQERPGFVRAIAVLEPRAPAVTGLFVAVLAFSASLTIVVGLLTTVAVYFLFTGPMHHPEIFVPAMVNIASYVLLENTSGNVDGLLSAFRAGRALFGVRVLQALTLLSISIVLGLTLHDVWGLVLASVGSSATALVHRLIIVRPYMRWRVSRHELASGRSHLGDIIRFGLKIVPGSLCDGVSAESGTWILGLVAPLAVVGAYSRAWMIVRQFLAFNFRITEMLFPTLVERTARDDRLGFDRALLDTLRYGAIGTLLLAAVGGAAAPGIMALFGPGFGLAAGALAILLLAPGLMILASSQRHALYALGRPLLSTASASIRMFVTLGAGIVLALALGPTGAAAALVLGLVADLAFCSAIVRRFLVTPVRRLWPARQLAGAIIAYLLAFAGGRGVYDAIGHLSGLVLSLAAAAAIYISVFLAVGGLAPNDRRRLSAARARLRARKPSLEDSRLDPGVREETVK